VAVTGSRSPTDDQPGEFVVADITDEDAVREAMDGIDVVVHLAGDPRPEAPWDSVLTNNIDGTQTVFEAAVDAGVEQVVFASSNHAVGNYETDERTPDLYREHDDYLLDGTELPDRATSMASRRPPARPWGDTTTTNTTSRSSASASATSRRAIRRSTTSADRRCGSPTATVHTCSTAASAPTTSTRSSTVSPTTIGSTTRSLARAREVLDYEPRDNSAYFDGEDRVVEPDA